MTSININKKILVTGGAGYLGSVLCRKLLKNGYTVLCIDPCLHGEESIQDILSHPSFNLIKIDLRNIADISCHVKGIYAIIHLAALVGDSACDLNEDETIQINYLCTLALAEAARLYKVERFLFASTTSVYGSGEHLLYECSHTNPLSIYAKTKLQCEKALLLMPEINATIFRTATIYGLSYRMRFDLVVNIMIAKAVLEGKLEIYGGNQWRPFIHVEDIADAYLHILETPLWKVSCHIFNIVGENYTIAALGQLIASLIPNTLVEVHPSSIDKRNYQVSGNKIETLLKFQSKYTIVQETPRLSAWILDNKVNIADPKYSNEKTLRKTYEKLFIEGEADKI